MPWPSILPAAILLAAAPQTPVAQVDDEVVTLEQVLTRQGATRASGGNADAAGILQDLINEVLLAREGYRQGLAKAPAVVAVAEAERRRAAGELLERRELQGTGKVKEEQLRALYHDTGDSVYLRMIVVASEEEAKAVLARLEGGASFAEEAQASLDPRGASRGGDLGTMSRGQLEPELQQAAFAAPVGKVHGPVKLALGWGIMKVEGRHLADEAGFAGREASIRRFAEAQLAKELRAHFLRQQRAKHRVALDEDFIRSTGSSLSATPEQAAHALATVAGRPVTYGQVLESVQRAFGGKQGGHVSGYSVKVELAWELVDRELMGAAAYEAGLARAPEVETKVRAKERDAVVRELASRLRAEVGPPTRAELESYYEKHRSELVRPGTRRCSHLVVKSREHATQLRQRALRGEDFEELATENSTDTRTAQAGGLLGEISDEQIATLAKTEPALAAALQGAPANAVTGPAQSRAGWHLVRCGAATAASPIPLKELEPLLTQRLVHERGNAAVKAAVDALRAKAKVKVNEAALPADGQGDRQGGDR